MRLNTMFISSSLALILFVYGARSQEVSKIGGDLSDHQYAGSSSAFTLTLWYESTVYQCQITPIALDQEHSCTPTVLGVDCSETETKLLILNDSPDAAMFDNLFFETTDGTRYTLGAFCMSDNAGFTAGGHGFPTGETCTTEQGEPGKIMDALCIDYDNCLPIKQVVYFDTSRPGETVRDAPLEVGTNVVFAADESCIDCGTFDVCSAGLVSEAAAITANLASVSSDVEANTNGVATIRTDVEAMRSDVDANTDGVATNAAEISSVSSDVAANTNAVATIRTDVETVASNVEANTNAVAANDADITAISDDVSSNANNVATNTADIAALSARIDAIVAKLQSVQDATPILDFHTGGTALIALLAALLALNIAFMCYMKLCNRSDRRTVYRSVKVMDSDVEDAEAIRFKQ